jgi:hypothetical protein
MEFERTMTGQNIPCEQCRCFTVDYQFQEADLLSDRPNSTHFDYPLPYICEDVFPDLPRLRASSDAGCKLCEALRSSLMNIEDTWINSKLIAITKACSIVTIRAKFISFASHWCQPHLAQFHCDLVIGDQKAKVEPYFLLAAPRGTVGT